MAQIAVAWASLASVDSVSDGQRNQRQDYSQSIRLSAFLFFGVSAIFSITSFVAHLGLIRLPFYRLTTRSFNKAKAEGTHGQPVSLRAIERKVRPLGFAVFWLFVVTLSVFPALTSSVVSVHDPREGAIYTPTLFVPIGFLIFNVGDCLGRSILAFERFVYTSQRAIYTISIARTLFIVSFLLRAEQADV